MKAENYSQQGQGLVFIPDISGFTQLVCSTDLITGQSITYELLLAIIGANQLEMKIAEIEGDAVLFYCIGNIPTADALYQQFEKMKLAFQQKLRELELQYQLKLNLTLKAIAHCGRMMEYPINGVQKIYGEVVLEAHRLLKNSLPERSYLLMTDELMEQSKLQNRNFRIHLSGRQFCEWYQGLRNLCFTYIPSLT